MKNIETELQLLGAWANGEHREDISLFDSKLFYNEDVYKDIDKGFYAQQLAANQDKYKVSITSLLVNYEPYSYYGVKGEALGEQVKMYKEKLNEASNEDSQEWIEKLVQTQGYIMEMDQTQRSCNYSLNFLEELDRRNAEKSPHYGLKEVDKVTEGLHRGQLIVLSARPGVGKSALALQITNNVVKQGYKVMYLPLEMTGYETFQRMLLQEQLIETSQQLKNLNLQQREKIEDYLDNIELSGNFAMYEGLNSLEAIERKIKEEKPFLVVVDQLTQVNPGGKVKDIRDKYIKVTNTLKRIALSENVCMLALSQLNRESTNRNKPGIENLAESDSTGRDADVVLMLKANEEEDFKTLKKIDLIIAKNRQGRTGDTIHYQFNGERYTFHSTASTVYEAQPINRL